jgi:hypothetical protein
MVPLHEDHLQGQAHWHRSVEVLRRYVREASVFRANSSARLGL